MGWRSPGSPRTIQHPWKQSMGGLPLPKCCDGFQTMTVSVAITLPAVRNLRGTFCTATCPKMISIHCRWCWAAASVLFSLALISTIWRKTDLHWQLTRCKPPHLHIEAAYQICGSAPWETVEFYVRESRFKKMLAVCSKTNRRGVWEGGMHSISYLNIGQDGAWEKHLEIGAAQKFPWAKGERHPLYRPAQASASERVSPAGQGVSTSQGSALVLTHLTHNIPQCWTPQWDADIDHVWPSRREGQVSWGQIPQEQLEDSEAQGLSWDGFYFD